MLPITHLPGSSALVLDSPHSGTAYPPDFLYACDMARLRSAEDTHVEKLYDFAIPLGVHWIEAHFPRSYLDANRNTTEIDETLLDAPWPGPVETDVKIMSKVRLGKGLVWRTTDDGVPIYGRTLSVREVQMRIERCWKPYHAAVAQAIEAASAQHGYSLHINCHSMPAIASSSATDFPGEAHADETGTGPGAGFNLNLPLPAGCTVARWFDALEQACARIAASGSRALVVSLGLDTFAEDPISKFALQSSDFSRLGERLAGLGLPTVFVLEGGYAAAALGTNAVNVIEGFEGL